MEVNTYHTVLVIGTEQIASLMEATRVSWTAGKGPMNDVECNKERDVSSGTHTNWIELLWTFPLHQVVSTLGVLLLANVLTKSAFSAPTARWILTEVPYFPVPVALALINGFFLQRRFRHQAMHWVLGAPASGPVLGD